MKTGLKAYRYLSEGIELMKELDINLDEAELVRCNSTGLTIYNPQNLASMIKGMKNTTITREQKLALRKQYERNNNINQAIDMREYSYILPHIQNERKYGKQYTI